MPIAVIGWAHFRAQPTEAPETGHQSVARQFWCPSTVPDLANRSTHDVRVVEMDPMRAAVDDDVAGRHRGVFGESLGRLMRT
jgi:hypothetical protein